jgi:hypothetical protein
VGLQPPWGHGARGMTALGWQCMEAEWAGEETGCQIYSRLGSTTTLEADGGGDSWAVGLHGGNGSKPSVRAPRGIRGRMGGGWEGMPDL